MIANPDTSLSVSTALTNPLPAKACEDYFGIQPPPNLDAMNFKYYYPMLDPLTSNILFVSGNADPACFPFAIAKENGNATNPNTTAFTIDGGSHCSDMGTPTAQDSPSLQQARQLEIQLATQWAQP